MSKSNYFIIGIVGSMSLLTGCGHAPKPEITPVQTAPKALSEQGIVVGGLRPAVDALPAFVAVDGTRQELPPPIGTNWAMPQGINAQGQIVGYATEPSLQTRHAFLWEATNRGENREWRAARLDDGGAVSSEAVAINARGDIVGTTWTADGTSHVCVWQQGTRHEIKDAVAVSADRFEWHPTGINAHGEIVGWGTDSQNRVHLGCCAFVYASSASAPWLDLGIGYQVAINDAGDIVGDFKAADGRFHACRWPGLSQDMDRKNGKKKRRIALQTLPGTEESHALAINNCGQIVGRAVRTATNTPIPVLWDKGQIVDLNTRLLTRFYGKLEEAIAINDRGQILCTARQTIWGRAVLLTPSGTGYSIQVF